MEKLRPEHMGQKGHWTGFQQVEGSQQSCREGIDTPRVEDSKWKPH